ncbi:acyl-CoA:6-aminopenicillanic acid acyl transferase [Ureibacillus xyleni]|uniref:Acyl-CoA:6-aminopenicillanic acid acyl transferase n=1 Tax=Ureibacillus xyleni TaxID=614648 RepID=A0A285TP03_9BACL|nr:C45 family peptidase [Ureibacillus xyleni]SOC24386.1 acyl-CoA:6-aminopenicillanic acid acyl transferase [Ureibacillus xyleni]
MHLLKASFSILEGNSYEIGSSQGEKIKKIPDAIKKFISTQPIDETSFRKMKTLIDQFNPGLNEELQGFAEALRINVNDLTFYTEACLQPGGCSLSAILPMKTSDNKTYVLRNYDLSPHISDMRLCTTKVKGKYSHIGFSVSYFGRSEGLNEMGLCVAFASCGIPIGNHPGMKKPVTSGLQFMVIVRALLENCKNVEEGIRYLEDMPIGTNMNLLLADAEGNAAIVETYDGEMAIKGADTKIGFINATNHALLPDIMKKEKGKLEQSIIRYNLLQNSLEGTDFISKSQLQSLFLREYPNGLTVHNYRHNFGTVHSILFNLDDKQLELSFGSPLLNNVYKVSIAEPLPYETIDVVFNNTNYTADFWKVIE